MTVLAFAILAAGYVYLLRRIKRAEREHLAHLHSDHEHLQATEDLMIRVSALDGKPVWSAEVKT